MNILDQARSLARQIHGNVGGGFAVEITFIAADSGITTTGSGTHAKIRLGLDPEGNQVNVRRAHVSVNETAFFIETGYPYKNDAGEIQLTYHKVQVRDVTGQLFTYMVDEWFPDKTLGVIVVFLKDFE